METSHKAARDGRNRRTFNRMVMRLAPALVVRDTDETLTAERVRLVDLSTTGAQILTQQQPAVGDRVWLRLTETRHNADLMLPAEVVWAAPISGRWRAGVHFQGLSNEMASMLARWLFYLQRQTQVKGQVA